MKTVLSLRPFMKSERTLVITCHECIHHDDMEGQVFTYHCLGNMLRKDDQLQQENIRYYIETKGCTQVIVAGHYNCGVIHKILDGVLSNNISLTVLQYNLEALLKEHSRAVIQKEFRSKMLIEFNIIEQLTLLMNYPFIREQVDHGNLRVIGVVMDEELSFVKEIFRDGVPFNNLITSN